MCTEKHTILHFKSLPFMVKTVGILEIGYPVIGIIIIF